MVDALVQYGLLTSTPDGLRITDDGRRALEFFRAASPVPFSLPVVPPPVVPMPPRSPALDALLERLGKIAVEEKKPPVQEGLLDFVMRSAEGVTSGEVKGSSSSDGTEKS